MRVATEQLDRLPCPVYHVLGNHELYHLSRSRVSELLHFPSQDCAHYAFQPRPHIRCLVLDTFDVSLEGRDPGDPRHDLALQYLECNPNQDRNDCEGLPEGKRHMVGFNGALSQDQMDWLRRELLDAQEAGDRVIVFAHVPLERRATNELALLWNSEEVLEVLRDAGR